MYPSWTHVQLINITDSDGPTDIEMTGEESVCTFDTNCEDGMIELTATSSDECTDVLDWMYTIYTDTDKDGEVDELLVIDGVVQSFSGTSNTIDASGTYPIGTHRVLYTFVDRCGNSTTAEFDFAIVNCKQPTAYCLNGVAVDLASDGNGGGHVELWAVDFDAGSEHPCGPDGFQNAANDPNQYVFISFDPVTISDDGNVELEKGLRINVNNGRVFTCDDFGENLVDVYAAVVTHSGEVIQSFCTATLDIQDNMGMCDNMGGMRSISGHISTEVDENLENAAVTLIGTESINDMTDEEGLYAFPLMSLGSTYSVVPTKNDDYLNGVSTLDLVVIQRHILGLDYLATPYENIAADINADGSLSASDLIQLRKLILGTISELPDNGSWRFINSTFEFDADVDPLDQNFPEEFNIPSLDADLDIDFTAIKVGDVNQSASANINSIISSTRNTRSVEFETNDIQFVTNEDVTVPVSLQESVSVTGFQFTIVSERGLRFNGISSSVIDIDDTSIGYAGLEDGVITISWTNAQGIDIEAGSELFNISFVATSNGSLSESLAIGSQLISAEIYDTQLEAMDIEFTIEGRADNTQYQLYQNVPNPFNYGTSISFNLPKASKGQLTIFDMTGKVVSQINSDFEKGINTVQLTRENLGASGVLYYQLKAGEYTDTKAMLLVD